MGQKKSKVAGAEGKQEIIVCNGCLWTEELYILPCDVVACSLCIENLKTINGDEQLKLCVDCNKPHLQPEEGFPPAIAIVQDDIIVEQEVAETDKDRAALDVLRELKNDFGDKSKIVTIKLKEIYKNTTPAARKAINFQLLDIQKEVEIFIISMVDRIKRKVLKSLKWLKEQVEKFWKSIKVKSSRLALKDKVSLLKLAE